MIPVPSGVRVWLAVGRTDMRKGMNGLALQVQQVLGRDPHAGDLYVFRGARGDLIRKLFGMTASACRSTPSDWSAAASSGRRRPTGRSRSARRKLAYMLDGIDWRNPVLTWRPEVAG
jgi:transposase